MMRKISLLTLVLTAFFLSCGEAGVESDISKTSEIEFDVTAASLNTVAGQEQGVSFDFADADFATYVSDAQNFTLNRLEYEVSGLTGTPSSTLDLEIRIDFSNNTASSSDGDALLSVMNIPVTNTTSPVLLFSTDADNPGLASATIVAALEQAVLNGNAVEIELTSTKTGTDLTEDFVFKLLFDLTARVKVD